ncbi:MAG: hypothetical protein QOF90_1615 [Acetobacteraceae bacterium]|nr:hypothetical protein [Acetobacteraceae bacterium]
MQIHFDYDTSVASAPAGFTAALAIAAGLLDALIIDPITINIRVGWNEANGSPLAAGELAIGGFSPGVYRSYSQLIADLTAHAGNMADRQALAALPANAASQLSPTLLITTAQEKAWGLIDPNAAGNDGSIGFSSAYTYDFDPANQNQSGRYGFIGVAEHEITHAMARITGDAAFGLTNYSAPGVLNTSGGSGYYSIDGGVTNLGDFAALSLDSSDWAAQRGDAFNYVTTPGLGGILSEVDQTLLGTLGFSEANTQFLVTDQTGGSSKMENGTPYSGPVLGLIQQLIFAGSANLAITANAPSSFIHTGSGNDAINVSRAGGVNVLDGSTGSNFLIGGSGSDTFFIDDRNATTTIWSTIGGFHSGDGATIWGITKADFGITWLNGQGAAGATGLTAGFTAAGKPDVNITIVGYTADDLTVGGRLSVIFGTTASLAGLPGSAYMNIRGI